jgi:hypothetical protein
VLGWAAQHSVVLVQHVVRTKKPKIVEGEYDRDAEAVACDEGSQRRPGYVVDVHQVRLNLPKFSQDIPVHARIKGLG